MYDVKYYHTVETLLKKGNNITEISDQLEIDRKTVRKIRDGIEDGSLLDSEGNVKIPEISRKSQLDEYEEYIRELLGSNKSAVIVNRKLKEKYNKDFKYDTVKTYVRKLKSTGEVYVPVETESGEEGQVDFGYMGYFNYKGKKKKVWVFCMVLSYSRYAYYEMVFDQKKETFIKCHINAFEYFGGVPSIVRIDNLKAGVINADFYEAEYQNEYVRFLKHYDAMPINCRIRRGQDKGKVESGIKYVKVNFLDGLKDSDFEESEKELKKWNEEICNKRIHGTTKKIPEDIFRNIEKKDLKRLPESRYEIITIEKRKVDNYGHVYYGNNYYSVPHENKGFEVETRSNGTLLRIFNKNYEQIALHTIVKDLKGTFQTKEEHKMEFKRDRNKQNYEEVAGNIGESAAEFLKEIMEIYPYNYGRSIMGIKQLLKTYKADDVNSACKRALVYKLISYRAVKKICQEGLQNGKMVENTAAKGKGFSNDLSQYDKLTGGSPCLN